MPPPMRYEKAAAISEAPRHTGGVAAVAFSPNGELLASAGLDRKLCIWKASDGKIVHTFVGGSAVLSLAWVSQDLLLCGLQDGSIAALTMTQSQLQAISFPRSHNFPVEHLATNKGRLASGSHEELAVWERGPNGHWRHNLDLPHPPRNSNNEDREVLVTSIHWTKSKTRAPRLLVTYMYHGYVIYNTEDWRPLMTNTLNGFAASASITADGRKLVVSNMTSGFDIYETETGNALGTLNHAVGRILAVPVLFVHGGNTIIGGSTVGEVNLWNVSTLHRHQILRHHGDDAVLALAAHYDRTKDRFMIATGVMNEVAETAVAIWCAEDGGSRSCWSYIRRWAQGSDCLSTFLYLFLGVFIGAVAIALALVLIQVTPAGFSTPNHS